VLEDESEMDGIETKKTKKDDDFSISREELETLLTNLKLKHRAEIDAIMVE
jgi:hypothetical protein